MTPPLAQVFEGYLDLRFRIDPVEATRAGRRELDGMYGAFDAAAVRAHSAALRSYTGALEEATADTLDDEIDQTAALHDARQLLSWFERERPFAHDPTFHVRHALDGIDRLTDNEGDPRERSAALLSRLRALPAFLGAAVDALVQPTRPALGIAAAMLPGGLAMVRDEVREALGPLGADPEGAAVQEAAVESLERFGDALALMDERARDTAGVGREAFERRLHTAHMIQDGADQLLRWAEHAYEESQRGVEAAAAAIAPGTPWREVVERVSEDSGAAAVLTSAYADAMDTARRFASAHGLVTVVTAPVRVRATPAYLAPLVPFALYDGPGAFAESQAGTLFLTAPNVAGSSVYRRSDIASTVVHEVIPGHHQQTVTANALERTVRRVLWSDEAREGWAYYCEAMMAEAGFFASPAARLLHARDVLWRTLRAIIDVAVHTKTLHLSAAERRLRDELGVDEATARSEVMRVVAHPTLMSCFVVGRREIERLRDDARDAWSRDGSGFSLSRFHGELLRYGGYPTALARWGMGLA
ncbi:MAG TPA: DUF885 domain-containing protein [Gemmatimonadaceae bacterium]|nr:DUF885 domain-containing protein [Gemmatimonadaceae bacterium]HSC32033.1 DUF885 domain-containing protein [Gemmatimonadaceae bacterium]